MVDAVNNFKPHVVFVGMTAPKQEKWAYQNKERLDTNIIASIGAVFDFYAGTVKRAPKWMQHSLPIVSTFEGGIRDIVDDGETGFLVPQKDVAALSEKLEYLILNGELRQQIGIAGRVKYEKEYTLNTFEIRIKEILNKILSK